LIFAERQYELLRTAFVRYVSDAPDSYSSRSMEKYSLPTYLPFMQK
jgi:hypothetical protein